MGKQRYTLEGHLNKLGKADVNCKGLESVYDLQKRKLNRYLSSVVTTFPTYSTHDAFHSANIISAIESILDKKGVKALSGTDTFLILICAYMHDVGMLYTEEEVRDIWTGDEFAEFLQEVREKNREMERAVSLVEGAMASEDMGRLWPLEVRQSVTILLMEYYRSRHGMRIAQVTRKDGGCICDLLRVEDSFLPERIIRMINTISMAHTWDFAKMMQALPQEDSFNGEDFHPRMLAFLLRLGDLCDLDNNRFNRVGIATFGTLSDESLSHYFKHKSVETLYISPEKIKVIADVVQRSVEAECRREWMPTESEENFSERVERVFHQTIREHISWKSWMEQEITDAKLNASQIFPKGWPARIPELEYVIKIDGREAVASDQNLKFTFSAEKAFSLIENISIYQDEKFIFVRELIQNAIDASKMQIWREVYANMGIAARTLSPFELEWEYPGIFSRFRISIQVDYDSEKHCARFQIQDSGIGISIPELKENILTTGNSWHKRKRYQTELQQMPEWLRPTGAFGIGLHTVFSVTNQMRILTKSDKEEMANEITLYSGKEDGKVFCRKSEKVMERGSIFSFAFELTEEQEQLYLEEDDRREFLYDFKNEMVNRIISEIQRWCSTPLVPVEVNGQPVVPELVVSTWVNELYSAERCNQLLDEKVEDSRYLHAFAYDYSGLTLWDRKHDIVMYVSLRYSGPIITNFKGMRLNIDLNNGMQNYISIQYLDILAGDADEMIDAARSKLKYETERKVRTVLEEDITYVKELYVRLIGQVEADEVHRDFMGDITDCACRYHRKEIDAQGVWTEACALKKKYMDPGAGANPVQVRSLESRIATYMICLKIIDGVLLETIRQLEAKGAQKAYAAVQAMDMSPWTLLDDIACRWKADWKGGGMKFNQPYFDYQIGNAINGYLECLAMIIVGLILQSKRIETVTEEVQWRAMLQVMYQQNMPFASKWHVTRRHIGTVTDVIFRYRGSGEEIAYGDEILEAILLPVTARIFQEWRYKAAYAGIDSISLELSKPYAKLLMDLPNQPAALGSTERSIWKQELSRTVYGLCGQNGEGIRSFMSLLEMQEFTLNLPGDFFQCHAMPFLDKLSIVKVEAGQNSQKITFALPGRTGLGVEADEGTIRRAFIHFWKTVEQTPENDQLGYTDVMGFEKYTSLILECTDAECDDWLAAGLRQCYIPVWDTKQSIKRQLDDYRCNENREECLERIAGSRRFEATVHYICRKKGIVEADGEERIRERYRAFVKDLLDVWFENMPRG